MVYLPHNALRKFRFHDKKCRRCFYKLRDSNLSDEYCIECLTKRFPEPKLKNKIKTKKKAKNKSLYSVDWTKTLRRSIRERDHYICQLCGEQQGDYAFDIHHIDYNKKNCNPNNLITYAGSVMLKQMEIEKIGRINWMI